MFKPSARDNRFSRQQFRVPPELRDPSSLSSQGRSVDVRGMLSSTIIKGYSLDRVHVGLVTESTKLLHGTMSLSAGHSWGNSIPLTDQY